MKKLTYLVDDKLYEDFRAAYPSAEHLRELLPGKDSDPTSMTYRELSARARQLGINPVGKKRDDLVELISQAE